MHWISFQRHLWKACFFAFLSVKKSFWWVVFFWGWSRFDLPLFRQWNMSPSWAWSKAERTAANTKPRGFLISCGWKIYSCCNSNNTAEDNNFTKDNMCKFLYSTEEFALLRVIGTILFSKDIRCTGQDQMSWISGDVFQSSNSMFIMGHSWTKAAAQRNITALCDQIAVNTIAEQEFLVHLHISQVYAGRVTKTFMIMHVTVNRTLTAVLETTFKTAETYLATALDAHDTAWFIKSVRGFLKEHWRCINQQFSC